jgi:cytochrome P450
MPTQPATDAAAAASTKARRHRASQDGASQDGAGQDAERFDIVADHADRLLTFGAGPHFCLGSNLARAELEEALTFLAPRMPGLALDGPPALGGVEGIYGMDALPLRWG